MTLFDLSDYNIRQLNPAQGTKPLDFGGGGITGSINLDGRFIAINTYHPEHGYITLTSIPPFPDEDRYDQQKVRAYRKSLVTNDGFGLQFEQEIIKREYFLIEDAGPFIRFTLADGTIAECVTKSVGGHGLAHIWQFSQDSVKAKFTGDVLLKRAEYTQLTEGGIVQKPPIHTQAKSETGIFLEISNTALNTKFNIRGITTASQNEQNGITFNEPITFDSTQIFFFSDINQDEFVLPDDLIHQTLKRQKGFAQNRHPVINRAITYGDLCITRYDGWITDHMILPLLWTRDSFYVASYLMQQHTTEKLSKWQLDCMGYIRWIFEDAWRGTYCKSKQIPLASAWARSYMANGMPKDNKAFQLDQQIFPFLMLANYLKKWKHELYRKTHEHDVADFLAMLSNKLADINHPGLFPTDETPADDEIPLHFHFSSHILLWYTLHRLEEEFSDYQDKTSGFIEKIEKAISKYFITEHNGKKIYAYATDGEGNYYIYHDANDIPLVMMPLWGFCDKDDEIWLNTIEFAFSDDNPGFFDGVLGSVHTPAAWSLGDAQELIFCKVVDDRERYQRVWERVEKAAQWDGALPEAYNIDDYSVYSRHWFAWPNAMVAIADSIPWNWEEEGEYAK